MPPMAHTSSKADEADVEQGFSDFPEAVLTFFRAFCHIECPVKTYFFV
jgi:hypothetical protein